MVYYNYETKTLGTVKVLAAETARLWGSKYLYTPAAIYNVPHEMEHTGVS